jgi:DNA-directed RNA polymerase subunit RPC12/RpoP
VCLDYGRQLPHLFCYVGKQIKDSDEKNFVCMECGKHLKKESLHFQMKKHAGKEDYHCDQCASKYVGSLALLGHKYKHTDTAHKETYLCSFCGQSFNIKEYMSKHVTKHTDEKPYQC